jgi:hypothetical protein
MLHHVVHARTDVSEERTVFLRSVLRLLVTANVVPNLPILLILMMAAIISSEMPALQEAYSVTSHKLAFNKFLLSVSVKCTQPLACYPLQLSSRGLYKYSKQSRFLVDPLRKSLLDTILLHSYKIPSPFISDSTFCFQCYYFVFPFQYLPIVRFWSRLYLLLPISGDKFQ